ncbi:MAG: hypothetical protein IPK28_14975 [Devosia sp.]|nr:hypothetical protein [Devosia sp.]
MKAISIDWRMLLACFALAATLLLLRANADSVPLLGDTDDAMRLVQVRDLLAGQGWYDLVQHRLDTPFGVEMHWSRLVDLPIAGLILGFAPFIGTAAAESVAAYLFPFGLLLVALGLSGRLAVRLAGSEAALPGMLLFAFSVVTFADFPPGRLDHHSVQLVILLALVDLTLGAQVRPRLGLAAGGVAALGLAIGLESLPAVLAAIGSFGLAWVLDRGQGRALRWFGTGLATGTAALLLATVSPQRWLVPACDALSVVYVAAGVATAALLAVLSWLHVAAPLWRLLAGLGAAAVSAAGLALLYPECLAGPYADLDPWLVTHWLSRVEEAQPALALFANRADFVIAAGLPTLLGLGFALWMATAAPSGGRERWVTMALFLLVAVAVTLMQARAARLGAALAPAVGGALVATARAGYLRHRRPADLAVLLGGWVGFAGMVLALAAGSVSGLAAPSGESTGRASAFGADDCLRPQAYTALAALPPGRLMAPIDLGAHLLAFTAHEVVGAPYHRAQGGLRDTLRFFGSSGNEAREIVRRRGLAWLVLCPALADDGVPPDVGPDAGPDALGRRLAREDLPDWLSEQALPGSPLRLFAIAPDS